MSRLLLLQSPRLVGVSPRSVIAAGNRNRIPTTTSTSPNANTVRMGSLPMRAPTNYGLTDVVATFVNFYAVSAGGESSSGLLAFNLKAAVEYPIGTRTRLTFGGAESIPLAPGDLVETDAYQVTIPAGALYAIRWYKETLGTGGGTYPMLVNQVYTPKAYDAANGDRLMSSASPSDDRTVTGTITAVAALTQDYGPTLVRGRPIGSPSNILIVGDSIPWGSVDKTGTSGQGDYLNGTSPSAPYPHHGDVGWVERGIATRHALFNLSVAGRSAAGFTEALNPKNFALVAKAPPTHLVLTTVVNDLLNSVSPTTADNVVTRNQLIQTYFKSRYGCKSIWVKGGPVARSTDNWATPENQFLDGAVAGIASPHWPNFTDNTGSTGMSRYNARLQANDVGADDIWDPWVNLRHPDDGRKWVAGRAQDGLHPNQAGHTDMAATVDATDFD